MSAFPVLHTERLLLRPLTDADLDRVVELHGDPEVMRFIGSGQPATRERVRREVLPALTRRHPATGAPGYWAAEERGTGTFLGWFELLPVDEPAGAGTVVELGYRLRRGAWGRGYATEGARALVRAGFVELGVRRVTAETMAVNTGSRRVLEKVGLRHVRTFFGDWPEPIAGAEHGDVEYALTREEWAAREADGAGADAVAPAEVAPGEVA